jgi:hypothetical protein
MFRDIILNLAVDGERDAVRDYALSFARAFEAHLTGVAFAYEPIAPGTIFDGVPEAIIATERAACEEAAQKAATTFDQMARQAAVSAEARVLSARAAGIGEIFGQLARRYDLSVVGQVAPDGGFPQDLILEAALFDAGHPVLVVPYIQSEPFKLDRALLCWDGSRSAARAVADALPLASRLSPSRRRMTGATNCRVPISRTTWPATG